MDSVGEGEGGKIWDNGIETCKISCMKRDASPGSMHGVLKSPTIIVLLLISPFILVFICLTYCGAPMLGAYIFIIVISSSWIDPLIIM